MKRYLNFIALSLTRAWWQQSIQLQRNPNTRLRSRSIRQTGDDNEKYELKTQLFDAIARSKRGTGRISEVLTAAEALEAEESRGEVRGRWSLIFSTLLSSRADADDDIFQAASNRVYETLFRFAPALAGGSESGFKARNEQVIENGLVDNVVNINNALNIRVSGTAQVQPIDSSFDITFDQCQFSLFDLPPLTVPLPRPRGKIITTYVDNDLRLSRGSRGGLFILRRISS